MATKRKKEGRKEGKDGRMILNLSQELGGERRKDDTNSPPRKLSKMAS
jgi:hypothetical protein